MTELETKLAAIVAALAKARQDGDALRIAHLMGRKETICAALSAPEQAMTAPEAKENATTKRSLAA